MGEVTNDDLDEIVGCISRVQRTRKLIDVTKIKMEIEARLEMMPAEDLSLEMKADL